MRSRLPSCLADGSPSAGRRIAAAQTSGTYDMCTEPPRLACRVGAIPSNRNPGRIASILLTCKRHNTCPWSSHPPTHTRCTAVSTSHAGRSLAHRCLWSATRRKHRGVQAPSGLPLRLSLVLSLSLSPPAGPLTAHRRRGVQARRGQRAMADAGTRQRVAELFSGYKASAFADTSDITVPQLQALLGEPVRRAKGSRRGIQPSRDG